LILLGNWKNTLTGIKHSLTQDPKLTYFKAGDNVMNIKLTDDKTQTQFLTELGLTLAFARTKDNDYSVQASAQSKSAYLSDRFSVEAGSIGGRIFCHFGATKEIAQSNLLASFMRPEKGRDCLIVPLSQDRWSIYRYDDFEQEAVEIGTSVVCPNDGSVVFTPR
jgi:hypothetical protein